LNSGLRSRVTEQSTTSQEAHPPAGIAQGRSASRTRTAVAFPAPRIRQIEKPATSYGLARACALVWLLAGLYCVSAVAGSWVVEGRVVGVSDGDTITVLDDAKVQHRVRFAGIDAPEKGQAFGNASKESLSRLVFNKRIAARCHKRDRYGREVCAVFVGTSDVGLEQVRAGMGGGIESTRTSRRQTSAPPTRLPRTPRAAPAQGCGTMRSQCRRGSGGRRHASDYGR
jgi:endonuclease YncB( thermonuclease family)